MAASTRNSISVAASCHDIVIQDAVSLLNKVRGPGDLSKLKVIKTRHEVKTQPATVSVFNACRKQTPEWYCTFQATKNALRMQHRFRCRPCKLGGDAGLCTVCANACHSGVGHRLEYEGYKPFFCVCGAEKGNSSCVALEGKGEKDLLLCTFKKTVEKAQHYFTCVTCALCMCTACVNICHKGHEVRYARLSTRFVCVCGSSRECKALN